MPEEDKFIGSYYPIIPHKIPTEGMLKSPYEKRKVEDKKPYMHIHRNEDGTWTDVDTRLVEILDEVGECSG